MPNENPKKFSIDKTCKCILRKFRQYYKSMFNSIVKNKKYHWVHGTCERRVQQFFIEVIGIAPGFYKDHEAIFLHLIFNTRRMGSDVQK